MSHPITSDRKGTEMRRLDPRCTAFFSARVLMAAMGASACLSLASAREGQPSAATEPLTRTTLAASKGNSTFASGPLRVSKRNPRYFEDPQGQVVYLAGDSKMLTVMDTGPTDPPEPFNFPGYLAFLHRHNLNFIRTWTRENVIDTESGFPAYVRPFPWPRMGPGLALDGKPMAGEGRAARPGRGN